MKTRNELKDLHITAQALDFSIKTKTAEYVAELDDDEHGVYITDHALVRYIQRVLGHTLPTNIPDQDKLAAYSVAPEELRSEMLTLNEDRLILNKQLKYYRRYDYLYVINGIAIVSVIKNNKI